MDSVALLDPKGAPHDIVQAIGRALRQKPNQGKLASLVVPVFLGPDEEPEDMFTSGSYRPLVNVLQALRAHDEEAVELLAIPQESQKRSVQPSVSIGAAPGEGEEENRLLLRFAAPRDPVMVAEWVSFNVIDTERQDWARGYAAARKFTQREGHLRVPFDHKEGRAQDPNRAYPLGHWISEQRKAYGAGAMDGGRVQRLEALGMIWDAGDHAFAEGLAAARAYFADHGTLAAPRSATALDRPVGQWLSNLRRPGTLADHPERAEALAALDPDWNPHWALDWQRHYAGVRECLDGRAQLADLLPGVTIHGHDVGQWLERQRQLVVWKGLMPEQRKRLTELGVEPLAAAAASVGQKKAQKGAGGPSAPFERGLAALRQYKAREGHLTVPRGHVEVLESAAADGSGDDSTGEPVTVKLGIWISNTKTRRAKLTADKLAALAALGLEWAAEGAA